jgi:hypothetical protein
MFAEEFLPVYNVSDEVATVVAARPAGGVGGAAGRGPDRCGQAQGLVGKFWRPVIEYAHVPAERFRDFGEPGYAKTAYALSVRPLADGRSLLAGLMPTATTDEHGSLVMERKMLRGIKARAERLAAERSANPQA